MCVTNARHRSRISVNAAVLKKTIGIVLHLLSLALFGHRPVKLVVTHHPSVAVEAYH